MKPASKPDIQDVLCAMGTGRTPWDAAGAGQYLAVMLSQHKIKVAAGEEQEAEPLSETVDSIMQIEATIADYQPLSIQEAAVKARFLFEFAIMSNFSGNITTAEHELDHEKYSGLAIVLDLEQLAQGA